MSFLRPAGAGLRLCISLFSKPLTHSCQSIEKSGSSLSRCFHSNPALQRPLSEFFDDPKNYDLEKVYVGRPWRKQELRLKSNEDLHKLWYVLLKERNVLLTMEQLAYDQAVPLASPERIFKVEESMENLLQVVQERDVAHSLLNYNETGIRKKRVARNFAGIPMEHTEREYLKPAEVNVTNKLLHPEYRQWMYKYIAQYEQKLRKRYRYDLYRCKKKQLRLMKEFPHLKWEDVKHIKPSDKKLKDFLRLSGEMNDLDFKEKKVY